MSEKMSSFVILQLWVLKPIVDTSSRIANILKFLLLLHTLVLNIFVCNRITTVNSGFEVGCGLN